MKLQEFVENFEKEQIICIEDKDGVQIYEGKAGVLNTLCTGNVKDKSGVVDGGVVHVKLL